ncbi:MAG: hypothetical protein M5U09_09835 [Gammaproteobacteria bacterium]|nr:hypothetical protein [Gammaproteobacteria bacterium]
MCLVPLAIVIFLLMRARVEPLYPRLPAWANNVMLLVYAAVAFYALGYLYIEYENVAIWRQGPTTPTTSWSAR